MHTLEHSPSKGQYGMSAGQQAVAEQVAPDAQQRAVPPVVQMAMPAPHPSQAPLTQA